jgi:hypothetical protein
MSSSPQTPTLEPVLVYTDEDIDRPLVEALRSHGLDVLTAQEAGTLGQTDLEQLHYASSLGRVILSYNRLDFRRLHQQALETDRSHGGIVLIPQDSPLPVRLVRARLLLNLMAREQQRSPGSHMLNWVDMQSRLHAGDRPAGFSEQEVNLALGRR